MVRKEMSLTTGAEIVATSRRAVAIRRRKEPQWIAPKAIVGVRSLGDGRDVGWDWVSLVTAEDGGGHTGSSDRRQLRIRWANGVALKRERLAG